ncbi:MAG: phage tail sheath subtilisin-like domain-containing protein [Rhizobiales bacterium]|nr:phage tail sheath subtilisin-like domain-containing protein [Hyphomicrobiales bacterium]
MPSALTYPGVYIEEIPSGVHTIIGVGTSIAAFVGRSARGPTNLPIVINGYADFERRFGGLWKKSKLGYAVRDFFLNGGAQAIIVRLYGDDGTGKGKAIISVDDLKLIAADDGDWGKNLRAAVDLDVTEAVADSMGLKADQLFNLTVVNRADGEVEQFRNLTLVDSTRRIDRILESESNLVRFSGDIGKPPKLQKIRDAQAKLDKDKGDLAATLTNSPTDKAKIEAATTLVEADQQDLDKIRTDLATEAESRLAAARQSNDTTKVATAKTDLEKAKADFGGSDGKDLSKDDFIGPGKQAGKKGLYGLADADLFNILCIPPYKSDDNVDAAVISAAGQYCEQRRAMLLVDPPADWNSKEKAKGGVAGLGTNSKNAALFFPRLRQPDPLLGDQTLSFVPCGAVAGIFARTDTTRGVWKAPAGFEATLVGVPQLAVPLTDGENGELNPLGVNCLRSMPAAGRIVWGARTLQGDDRLASEWKYIPVRRTALFIEESLYRGTHWVVFEPNDEPLWAQIRLNVGAFMNDLFRQGAFQGGTPREAYFVKCDKETTTQSDINKGIVNILVGFAPLKPAEFVLVKLQQIAGQIQT